ncbi:cation:proton antiporter [Actinocrinis sp.]|uniref:cation:proton antiporter domain-containing protein n=1 Tax=Actinocrinis sp. TaxID=1920516 RepID=UPI002D2D5A96|nr:cation:proton antiporter [Actinocrinis sp.]HZP53850.1 cation:proton antiporter [Actinocrinis sp.]
MSDTTRFGLLIAVVAAVVMLAVLSNRLSARLRVPAPAFFLLGAAVASDLVPRLGQVPIVTVQRIVTVALAVILFDGGMHLGRARLRANTGAVLWIGTSGTLVTAAALAVLAHGLFGLSWGGAALLGTALAPTDPAVVFSVLGRRQIAGRAGVLLEGESGANDPVGIALMAALLPAVTEHRAGAAGFAHGVEAFGAQMLIGLAVGVLGGLGLREFTRRVPLPSEGLYPLRVLAGALGLYGVAAAADGSGFLAVFVAGIVLCDARAPYAREVKRFHAALAGLAEITAFTVLGLTVSLHTLPDGNALGIGLALAVLLAFLVRPVLVGLLLLPIRLPRRERAVVLWGGLKGAVPILLGSYLLTGAVRDAERLYSIVFVVVAFSVLVQGGLLPTLAARLRVPTTVVEPEPFSLGVRLREEPDNLRRLVIAPGAPADGAAVHELDLDQGTWISVVLRDGRLLELTGQTVLRAEDEVLLLTDPLQQPDPAAVFTDARPDRAARS